MEIRAPEMATRLTVATTVRRLTAETTVRRLIAGRRATVAMARREREAEAQRVPELLLGPEPQRKLRGRVVTGHRVIVVRKLIAERRATAATARREREAEARPVQEFLLGQAQLPKPIVGLKAIAETARFTGIAIMNPQRELS